LEYLLLVNLLKLRAKIRYLLLELFELEVGCVLVLVDSLHLVLAVSQLDLSFIAGLRSVFEFHVELSDVLIVCGDLFLGLGDA
jgi:hypothetical protein